MIEVVGVGIKSKNVLGGIIGGKKSIKVNDTFTCKGKSTGGQEQG